MKDAPLDDSNDRKLMESFISAINFGDLLVIKPSPDPSQSL